MSQIRNNPPAATVGQKLIKKINMDCMAIATHRLANTHSVSARQTTKQAVLNKFFIGVFKFIVYFLDVIVYILILILRYTIL